MKATLPPVIMLTCLVMQLSAQRPDSLQEAGRAMIRQQYEFLEADMDEPYTLDDLTADLEYYLEQPLNLNAAEREELRQLVFLNDVQIRNLLDYRKKYGQFYTIYELKEIEGFGRNTIEKIAPFVMLAPYQRSRITASSLLHGRHELVLRYRRRLTSAAGYRIPDDSLQLAGNTGSFYLGDPNSYYLRYAYKVRNKLSLGFLAGKDPGEPFFGMARGVSPTLAGHVEMPAGFDHYSFHACLENTGIIRTLVAGDFRAQFGQGLTLWTGMSYSGGSDPSALKRYAPGIRPGTSSSEGNTLRGAAATLQWRRIDISAFYSRNMIDANISSGDGTGMGAVVTSMPEGGYHRTISELSKRKVLLREVYGANLLLNLDRLRTGITLACNAFGLPVYGGDEPANVYAFSGDRTLAAGISYDLLLKKTNLFGEFSMSRNGGWALLNGITHTTASGSVFGMLVREYRPAYQNPMAGAAGRRDNNANDRGVKMMAEVPLPKKISLQWSTELYSHPWLTYRMVNAGRGSEHILKLLYRPGAAGELSLRYRFRSDQQKSSSNRSWIDSLLTRSRHELKGAARFPVSASLSLGCQAAWNLQKSDKKKNSGSLLHIDMHYHPLSIPLKWTFRYALFHTTDYNNRIYAYENDLLYASSMPAYYGKGTRVYAMVWYGLSQHFDIWLKFSLTCYTDRDVTGSGTEEAPGNMVPETKVQLRFKR